jgi:hypothetical protein
MQVRQKIMSTLDKSGVDTILIDGAIFDSITRAKESGIIWVGYIKITTDNRMINIYGHSDAELSPHAMIENLAAIDEALSKREKELAKIIR